MLGLIVGHGKGDGSVRGPKAEENRITELPSSQDRSPTFRDRTPRAMFPSVPQLPPGGQERSKTSAQRTALQPTPASAVRGPEIKCRPRKGKVGTARHKEAFRSAREGGDSRPCLVHTPIPRWIILRRKYRLR